MEWNKDTVIYFLNLIRERPVIWDAQCRDFKDKIKRNIATEEIALLMGCTVKTVNTKWISLKNQYSREKRNMTGMCTGSGANDIYTTKWYCFKEMESLMDGNKPEQTYNNLFESSSSLPMPRPQSTPTPPLLQPPSPTTPQLLSPLMSPPIPPASTNRKKNCRNTMYKEAMDTIKTIREDRATRRNEPTISKHDDDITAYGLYIAAQIRMFRPILQSNLKLDIQTLLHKYEIQNIDYSPDLSTTDHSDYSYENQNLNSPIFKVSNASTFRDSDNSIASTSSYRQLDYKQPETTSKNVIVISNDGSLKESVTPENSTDLPGLPKIVILHDEIINRSTNTTQMDDTINYTLQSELNDNSGLPQILLLPQTNTTQIETETKNAVEYLLKFKD